jgi:acetoin utilization protein AcuB
MHAIASYMTKQPWSVQIDDSINVATEMMAHREIHHLPVLDGGQVVGMVTARDLGTAAHRLGATVEAVMTPVHLVQSSTPLEDVLEKMASNRWDAVVVADDGNVEGIFTAMDAVRVLRDLVARRAA